MTRLLTIWLLGDGKPGHENQSLGLAEAVGRRIPSEVCWIRIEGSRFPLARLVRAWRAGGRLPRPDLIIGAGHATHLPLSVLGRRFRVPCVLLMRPSLPLGWFDLCLAPRHDFPPGTSRENLILTQGALNRVRPGDSERSGRLILIGGPSRIHDWDGPALLEMIRRVVAAGGDWQVSDSRRTPAGFIDQLSRQVPGVRVFSHQDTPSNWIPETLRASSEVWVTEDSVSMIYEAITSGARVGLLPLPRLRSEARVLRGIDELIADEFLTTFAVWSECGRLAQPPRPLAEADRCAGLVLERFFPAWKS